MTDNLTPEKIVEEVDKHSGVSALILCDIFSERGYHRNDTQRAIRNALDQQRIRLGKGFMLYAERMSPYAAWEGKGMSPLEAGCPCNLCTADRIMKREIQEDELDALGAIPCAYRFEDNDRIQVVWRDGRERHDLWAITNGGACLAEDGLWEVEPMPSNRTDDFLKRCRFPLDEALRRAAKYINDSKKDKS